jgi:hypothetical protein
MGFIIYCYIALQVLKCLVLNKLKYYTVYNVRETLDCNVKMQPSLI